MIPSPIDIKTGIWKLFILCLEEYYHNLYILNFKHLQVCTSIPRGYHSDLREENGGFHRQDNQYDSCGERLDDHTLDRENAFLNQNFPTIFLLGANDYLAMDHNPLRFNLQDYAIRFCHLLSF